MKRRAWKVQAHKGWTPFEAATRIPPSPERIAVYRGEAERRGWDPDAIEDLVRRDSELFVNDRYTVSVRRRKDGSVEELSIRRNDRGPDMGWRDLQRIKTELAGAETEAFELFPAESRLVDTANQRWLWCLRPGERIPVGFNNGRQVSTPEEARRFGARQS